jgi:hypothetical protein
VVARRVFRSPRFLLAGVAAAVILSGTAGTARADDKTAKAAIAQKLFDEAIKLMDSGKYSEACPKLARSQDLAPSGGTLLNLGDCYEKNGQTASAWVSFRDAAARAAAAGQKQAQAAALVRADALATKLVRLTISLAPGARVPGLEIKRDGVLVSLAELGLDVPLDPGVHKVEATAPGRAPWSKDVIIATGTASEPVVVPELAVRADAPSAAQPVADAKAGDTQRIAGLAIAGGGLLIAGIGGIFGLSAFSTNDEALTHCRDAPDGTRCDPTGLSLTDDARSQATVATVLVGLGTVAMAGGVVLFVLAPKSGGASTTGAVRAAPFVTPSTGGLSFQTRW